MQQIHKQMQQINKEKNSYLGRIDEGLTGESVGEYEYKQEDHKTHQLRNHPVIQWKLSLAPKNQRKYIIAR